MKGRSGDENVLTLYVCMHVCVCVCTVQGCVLVIVEVTKEMHVIFRREGANRHENDRSCMYVCMYRIGICFSLWSYNQGNRGNFSQSKAEAQAGGKKRRLGIIYT